MHGVGDVRVGQERFVEAAVGVGVVVHDLERVDDAVFVLLDFLGSGAASPALVRQGVFVGVLGGIRVDEASRVRRVWVRTCRIWLAVASGHFWRARARKPATRGVEFDVPLAEIFSPVS